MPNPAPAQRPPKPGPVPLGGPIPKTVLTDDNLFAKDISVSSTASRDNLRRDVQKRRSTLTPEECNFLERLVMEGDEIEVSMAHETLLDEDLFFDPTDTTNARASLRDDSDRGWNSERGFHVGGEFSVNTAPSDEAAIDVSTNSRASLRTTEGEMHGSEKRREHLENRRTTQNLSRLWNAHANGLALSKSSSRRSLLARQNSISSSSARPGDLYARPETDAIFRSSIKKLNRRRVPMDDNLTDNNRRRRHSMSQLIDKGQSAVPAPRRSSLRLPTKPTQYRRLQSDASYKSVTFKDDSSRTLEEPSSPGKPPRIFGRRDSTSSIPSLHQAHPIRSPSNASAAASFASLHLAHHIRSDSASYFDDIESKGEDESRNASGDEKKMDPDQPAWDVPQEVFEDGQKPIEMATKLLSHDQSVERAVMVRRASVSNDHGEGFEVAQLMPGERRVSQKDALWKARRMESLVTASNAEDSRSTLPSSISFDDGISCGRANNIFRRRRERSLSDENLAGILLGGSKLLLHESSSLREVNPSDEFNEEDPSWNLDDESTLNYYDAWKVIEDEYENGYGGGGALPFKILGTSGDDVDSHPHVLSPPLMESLQSFLPSRVSGDNFWMKYSLVRDGAAISTFLQYARGAQYSILAIETVDGEVFGCFTSEPWRKNWNYFGGEESFLWRMRHSRKEKCHSIIDQAHMESEIDVYPFVGVNHNIQLCTTDKIAIGGGTGAPVSGDASRGSPIKEHDWGFGLAVESDMLNGTSSPSVTFGSPSLSKDHADGSRFEIVNLELWTLTPCAALEDAEKLELGLLFLRKHG